MKGPISNEGLPLEGIRAVCVTAVWAGPFAAQILGDWGCEIIHVESIQRRQLHTRGYTLRFPEGTTAIDVSRDKMKNPGCSRHQPGQNALRHPAALPTGSC